MACPAHHPLDHAHWKLYPPSHPVTSTASPMKYRPVTARASIVRDERPAVSMPPTVTSALLHPSESMGVTSHRLSRRAVAAKTRSGRLAISRLKAAVSFAIASASRLGRISANTVLSSALGRVRLRSRRNSSASIAGARSIRIVAPFFQYEEI